MIVVRAQAHVAVLDMGSRRLTFDLSGLPKAGPLEGMVRALVGLKPIGSHHAELVLFVFFEFGLVFQVGFARTKTDSALSGRPAFEKRCIFALGHVHRLGTKARWLPKREASRHYSRRMPEL